MKNLAVMDGNEIEVKDFSLVERWIKFADVKPASEKSYRKGIKNFINFLREIGIDNPCSVTRENILDYKNFLEKKYKSVSTRNLYLTATKLFFDFLKSDLKVINVNPASKIKGFKLKDRGHKKDAVTSTNNAKILKSFDTSTLKGKRDYALYALMSVCGLRCVEVERAYVGDFKEDENGKMSLKIQCKGHDEKDESVHVPAPVMNIIQNYLNERGELTADAPLFASLSNRNRGKGISSTRISTIIKNIFRVNGIDTPRITAHSLRHGAATAALKNGATLQQVQNFLHHTSITVTMRYLHTAERETNPSESLCAAAFGLI